MHHGPGCLHLHLDATVRGEDQVMRAWREIVAEHERRRDISIHDDRALEREVSCKAGASFERSGIDLDRDDGLLLRRQPQRNDACARRWTVHEERPERDPCVTMLVRRDGR